MKNNSLTILFFLLFVSINSIAQPIPVDSLYLGNKLPGIKPEIFLQSSIPNFFVAERIAISIDNKNIYYQELDGYSEMDGKPHTVCSKYFSYENGKWNGPFTLFDNLMAPFLSNTGDTMYLQKGVKEAYYSLKMENGWSKPVKFLQQLKITHYFQTTINGNHYISAYPANTLGGIDFSRMIISSSDTSVSSLGLPLNTLGHDFDFFVSRDEQFMIVTTPTGLAISYSKPDGSWTNPKNLGKEINFGLNAWGPFVTPDNKYLFYTTGTKPDYSDTYIYWVDIENLIKDLKLTNYVPYLKNKISDKTIEPETEFNFAISNDTFIDDDSNHTLTYSAILEDGKVLPTWLNFSEKHLSFSGKAQADGIFTIRLTVTDDAGESASSSFKIYVKSEKNK